MVKESLKVSIIIPVYNVEKYLKKCLTSVINQTLKDIEIICIDDGSTDNSLNILNNFMKRDLRITVNSQPNKGTGSARNLGMSLARGEFIGFVDPDDYIDLDYFEKLYTSAKKTNADIACASILRVKKFYSKYNVKFNKMIETTDIQNKMKICGDKNKFFFYAWNKIYKRLLIKNFDIKFAETKYYEDVPFAIRALYYSEKLVTVPNTLYHYVERANSAVKSKNTPLKIKDKSEVFRDLQIFANDHNIKLPKKLNYHQYPLKIDLVYLWVDGSDREWQKKKRKYEKRQLDKQANAKGRYKDNNELKYSLRSVEENAPWINKIYIVTDNQHPKWLDINHPKIEVVPHSKIIPKQYLPTYNSNMIEMYIENIPGLSEYFLYANDDMIFNKPVTPDFFYTKDGKPKIRFKQQISKRHIKTSMYSKTIIRMQEMIYKKYGKKYPYAPHHTFDAYTKTILRECKKEFEQEYQKTNKNRFRTGADIQRVIASYYALVKKKGKMIKVTRYRKGIPILKKIILIAKGKYESESRCFALNDKNLLKNISKYDPVLVCINDDEHTTDEDRARLKIYFENRFPYKSMFEK